MRLIALILICMLTGCIGTSGYHNPMQKPLNADMKGDTSYVETVWWRLDTSTMKPEDNPWNKFVPKYSDKSSDPWADFEEPRLFPKDWKHKAKSSKPTGSIKKIAVEREVY